MAEPADVLTPEEVAARWRCSRYGGASERQDREAVERLAAALR